MKILLALNHRRCSETIVQFLSETKFPSDSQVICLHVVEPASWQTPGFYPVIASYSTALLATHREAGRKLLLSTAAILKENFFTTVSTLLLEGDVAAQIREVANDFNADVIVLAKTEKNLFENILFGSISNSVLQKSTCSVAFARSNKTAQGEWLKFSNRNAVLSAKDDVC